MENRLLAPKIGLKNALIATVGVVCALFMGEPQSFGQNLQGTNLTLSGGALTVDGMQHNNALILNNGQKIVWKDYAGKLPSLFGNSSNSSIGMWMNRTAQSEEIKIGCDWPVNNLPVNTVMLLGDQVGSSFHVDWWDGSTWADCFHVDGASGNVGIGTTKPEAALDVRGDAKFSEAITVNGMQHNNALILNNGQKIVWKDYAGKLPSLSSYSNNSSIGMWMVRTSQSEEVRIGCDWPVTNLPVDAAILLGHQSGSSFHVNWWDGNTWADCFYVDGASGNVGIGTKEPEATLDVRGDARFSGAVHIEPQGDLSMGEFTAEP